MKQWVDEIFRYLHCVPTKLSAGATEPHLYGFKKEVDEAPGTVLRLYGVGVQS